MNKKGQVDFIVFILVALCVVTIIVYKLAYAFTDGKESITIEEKWVKYKSSSAKYLVSSTNGQVFEITDSWIKWRFDSSNLYADLKEDQTCTIKTQGWRFGLLSDYKNILEADCKGNGNNKPTTNVLLEV